MSYNCAPAVGVPLCGCSPDAGVLVIWNFNEVATGKMDVRKRGQDDMLPLLLEFIELVRSWPRAFVLLAGSNMCGQ